MADDDVIRTQRPQRRLAHPDDAVTCTTDGKRLLPVLLGPITVPVRSVVLHDHRPTKASDQDVTPRNPGLHTLRPDMTPHRTRTQKRNQQFMQLGEQGDLSAGLLAAAAKAAPRALCHPRAHLRLPLVAPRASPPHTPVRTRYNVTWPHGAVHARMPLRRDLRGHGKKTVRLRNDPVHAGGTAALSPIGDALQIGSVTEPRRTVPIHLPIRTKGQIGGRQRGVQLDMELRGHIRSYLSK
nr:hypothetical protein [Streptomyces olivaceus]